MDQDTQQELHQKSLRNVRALLDKEEAEAGRLVELLRHAAARDLDVAEAEDKLFVINSFSKAWAMTGWRIACTPRYPHRCSDAAR